VVVEVPAAAVLMCAYYALLAFSRSSSVRVLLSAGRFAKSMFTAGASPAKLRRLLKRCVD
jgi:hypothetical protein